MKNTRETDTSINGGELVKELVESLAAELYIEPEEVDLEESFMEMGLDSIIGVEWIRSINKKYGCSISTTKIYQYPNILGFAEYMQAEIFGNTNTDDSSDAAAVQMKADAPPQTADESELIGELIESLAKELYLEPEEIDLEESFTGLGLDSIIGVEWVRSINKKYGCSINTTKIYQYPNLLEFAEYLRGELKPQSHEQTSPAMTKDYRDYTAGEDSVTEQREETASSIDGEQLMGELLASLAEELYLEPEEIDPEESFTELGLDSIIAVEWIRSINKKYNITINTTKIYQYPDLNSFSGFLLEELGGERKADGKPEGEEKLDDLLWQVYQGEADVNDVKGFFKA